MNDDFMPMYEMKVAAALIPMTYGALKTFLYRNKSRYPAVYINREFHPRKVRLLTSGEILSIRDEVIRDQINIKPYVPLTIPGF